MSEGKAIAQAGHAYVAAVVGSLDTLDGQAYAKLSPGTKITLDGGCEEKMISLHDRLWTAGIPSYKIFDRGHVELPDFDGSPVLTAIGIGPLSSADAPGFLRKLRLIGQTSHKPPKTESLKSHVLTQDTLISQ